MRYVWNWDQIDRAFCLRLFCNEPHFLPWLTDSLWMKVFPFGGLGTSAEGLWWCGAVWALQENHSFPDSDELQWHSWWWWGRGVAFQGAVVNEMGVASAPKLMHLVKGPSSCTPCPHSGWRGAHSQVNAIRQSYWQILNRLLQGEACGGKSCVRTTCMCIQEVPVIAPRDCHLHSCLPPSESAGTSLHCLFHLCYSRPSSNATSPITMPSQGPRLRRPLVPLTPITLFIIYQITLPNHDKS